MRWLRWARRDRRLAWLLVVDGILALLVVVVLLKLILSSNNPLETTSPGLTPATSQPLIGFGPGAAGSPPPPTFNPTQLVALPNQGQSAAPPPPPGLLAEPPATNSPANPTP